MKRLMISAALAFGLTSLASASTTITFDGAGTNLSDYGLTVATAGDTGATIESGTDCGPLNAGNVNATSFLCLTGNGNKSDNGSVWSLDDVAIGADAKELTISFDIAGDSTYDGGRDILEASGSFIDFVLFDDGSNELINLNGGDIETISDNGAWASYSQTFTTFETGSNYTLGVRVSGDGNEFIALDNIAFTAAVPEPATWLMMLAGFAMIGTSLKRRRAATLAA